MRCYQSVCLLLLAAAAAPAPAPDGASYGAPPPSNGGAGGGFGAGSVRGPAAGFRGGLGGGSGGRPSGGFGGGFDGGSAGRPNGGFGGGFGAGSVRGPAAGFRGGLDGGSGGRPSGGFGGGLDGGPGGQPDGGFGGGRGAGSARRGALIEPVGPGLRPDGLPIGPGTPYSFSWAVDESQYGNQYGHTQESDGVVTQGEYRVLLPDGRTQIVTYSVEGDSGFQAQVTYEGEVQLPAAGRPGPPAAFGGPGRAPAVPGRGRGGSGRGRGGSGVRPPVGDGRVTRLGAGLTIPPRLALQRGSPFPFGTDGGTEQQTEDRPSTSYGY